MTGKKRGCQARPAQKRGGRSNANIYTAFVKTVIFRLKPAALLFLFLPLLLLGRRTWLEVANCESKI